MAKVLAEPRDVAAGARERGDAGDDSSRALAGVGVCPGCAVGPVRQVCTTVPLPADESIADDPEATGSRVTAILKSVSADLRERAQRVQGEARDVLEATAMIASDSALAAGVRRHLSDTGPAHAIDRAVREVVETLSAGGEYWQERSTDLFDVRDRAVARWCGLPEPGTPKLETPVVLVARDLAAADAALLDPALVIGLVLEAGGPTAHTAIIAAQLGIPCAVRVPGATALADGTPVALDGGKGTLVVDPSADEQAAMQRRNKARALLRSTSGGPGALSDGTRVALYANVGTVADAREAARCDVEGIGLFRTELLFGGRDTAPDVEEQTVIYTEVFAAFGERPVTVRTLDAGADKPLPFARQDGEDNPALGVRGIRLGALHEQLLLGQLDAIAAAQAATGAHVRVMAPMIATADEARWFASRARDRGLAEVGVMIEVPAAALRAADVLAGVDFASIGTNDLSQYVMAADRTNPHVSGLLTAWQPAVLDLIAMTTATDRPVGVCGEAAADPLLALVLVGCGVRSLSMAPGRTAEVRHALSLHTLEQCRSLAERARAAAGSDQARAAVLAGADPGVADLL